MTATRNWKYSADDLASLSPFGSVQADLISMAEFRDGQWSEMRLCPMSEFRLHPGAHCLHYGSSCFEGLKAYRSSNDSLAIFRLDMHARRMRKSADILRLPPPPIALFEQLAISAVRAAADDVPPAPGALYLRPVLLGTDTNIGAASTPSQSAVLYVMASPVGDYFAGGERALRLLVEDQVARTAPKFGRVKTGANYAAALGLTMDAKEKWKVDQVLFCPDGDVQETGAANFLMINDDSIVTKPLNDSFLHGITRDSILTIARDLGYQIDEHDFSLDELLKWTEHGEAALSGTAAVLTGVGTLIYQDQEYPLGEQKIGANTRRLRQALVELQQGIAEDSRGWLTQVDF